MRKQVAYSLIDQGFLSAFNFALNLLLVRYWKPSEFGLFAILFSLGFIFTGLQNALVNTPYSVWVPAAESRTKANLLRQSLAQTNVLLIIVILLPLTLLLSLQAIPLEITNPLALPAYYGATLIREYLRSRWTVEMQLSRVLLIDLVYLTSFCLIAICCLWLNGIASFQLEQLLWSLASAQLIGASLLLVDEFRLLKRSTLSLWLSQYKPIWQQSRWAVVGVSTTELQNRAYVFVVGAFFGTAAVGFIQAGRLLFGPLNIAVSAWTRVAKPTLAKLWGQHEAAKFLTLSHHGVLGFIVFNLLFSCALWLAWPLISQHVYGDKYVGVEVVVTQWALVTLVFHVRSVYSAAVQASIRFKQLAFATIAGGLVSLITLLLICLFGDSFWSVSSIIIGEAIACIYVFNLLPKRAIATAHKEAMDAA